MRIFRDLILCIVAAMFAVPFLSASGYCECKPEVYIQLTQKFSGDLPEFSRELARLYTPDVSAGPRKIADTPIVYTAAPGIFQLEIEWYYEELLHDMEVVMNLTLEGDSVFRDVTTFNTKNDVSSELKSIHAMTHSMAAILATKLAVTSAEATTDKYVIDADSPENITIYVDKLKSNSRTLPTEERSSFYCLGLRLKDQVRKTEEIVVSEKEIMADTGHKFGMAGWNKSCNSVDSDPCARPVATPQLRMISAFGYQRSAAEGQVKIKDPPKITLRCPVRIQGGPVVPVVPGEEKEILFKVVDFKDQGLGPVDVSDFELHPESFGELSVGKFEALSSEPSSAPKAGDVRGIKVTAADQAQGMADVVCKICEDTPEDLLGEDENGKPLYYSPEEMLGFRQISVLPEIKVSVIGEIDIHKDLNIIAHRKNSYQQTRETETGRETMELTFKAQFLEREEALVEQPEIGFRGSRITYLGEASNVSVDLSTKTPRKTEKHVNGWFENSECGRVTYNYLPKNEEHKLSLMRPNTELKVYYHHFIPAPDSALKVHPIEGLSFNNLEKGKATFNYEINIRVNQMETDDSCGVSYSTLPMPKMEFPLHLDQYLFPVPLLTMISNGCYGLGRDFELMNKNKYSQLFRKLNEAGTEFDEYRMERDISLNPGMKADCWEYDNPDLEYSGGVDAYMYIESRAEILRGSFDLKRRKSNAEITLEKETPAYLEYAMPDIPDVPDIPSGVNQHSDDGDDLPQALQEDLPQALPDDFSQDQPATQEGSEEPFLFLYDKDGRPVSPEEFLENL